MPRKWADDNPYFLLIVSTEDDKNVQIDLGRPGWAKTHKRWMRKPAWWYLARKTTGQIALAMIVREGEQPYYTKRHVGQFDFARGRHRETACHGIGKKRLDGHVDRLWILPDQIAVCGGDDVEALAMEVVKTLEWQEQTPTE